MTDIIDEAHKKRFKVSDDDPKKQGIVITESWLQELMKHPYHSKKPGTGIFLMKERAKVYKSQSSRVKHELSKRLQAEEEKHNDFLDDASGPQKKKKGADGSAIPVQVSSQQSMIGAQKAK